MITGANNPGMAEEAQTASQTLPDFKITFSPELISVAIIASGNLESSIRESPIYSHSKSFRLWLSNKPYFESLNDSDGNEILMGEIFENLQKKKQFKSKILSLEDQKFLFDNISKIEVFKGKTLISDIAFISKSK